MAPIVIWHSRAVSSLDAVLVWLDSAVCSQNPSHSFWIDGNPLPLCARDFGLFTGFLLGLAILQVWRPRWSWLYLLGLLPMLIDGTNSFANDAFGTFAYAPNNPLRLATGLVAGISLTLVLQLRCHAEVTGRRISPGRDQLMYGSVALLGLLSLTSPYLALALLGTAGALALAAANNRLIRPMPAALALSLAVPELALVATVKHGLLLLLVR